MKIKFLATLGIATTILLSACNSAPKEFTKEDLRKDSPNGVYYEIFVRSFADSDGDGIGDLKGATEKLDYLEELGVEGIWLMPINPSESYHGYDVTDYKAIEPDYGTVEDFKKFVNEAHKRDIKIIMDFVVNHTSNKHPWFQKALEGDKYYSNYYMFEDENTNTDVFGEFGQTTVWHGSKGRKYQGIFWEGMPDLNFDNPKVRAEIVNAGTFWLKDIGVDGFRLDAAKYIYSSHDFENHEEKDIEWWYHFHSEMKKVNPNVFLVGEVWDSAAVIAPYLKEGLTSGFNFDTSEKILSSVKGDTDAGIAYDLEGTRTYYKSINPNFVDSTMITNHDMNRVMSEVDGDINKAKMAANILLTLPGNPFIYYGEEIGMLGVKPDEHIREPFVWEVNPDGKYETKWIAAIENTDREKLALENQMKDENSLYNHYKKLIYARRSSDTLIKGEIKSTPIDREGLVMFERTLNDKGMFVVHNMTKKVITLDLTEKFFEDYQKYNKFYFTTSKENKIKGKKVVIQPYSSAILNEK